MLKDPMLYSVGLEGDPSLVQERADVVHTVAALLEKCHLIKYEHSISRFCSTELGWIASHYYVTHSSMATYPQHLRPTMSHLEPSASSLFPTSSNSFPCARMLVFLLSSFVSVLLIAGYRRSSSRGSCDPCQGVH